MISANRGSQTPGLGLLKNMQLVPDEELDHEIESAA